MNDPEKTYEALTIHAAESAGHFVMQAVGEDTRGLYRPILFAGTLEQCLSWVKDHICR